jgi:hypothetical protein
VLFIFAAATLAVFVPFLKSIGVPLTSGIVLGLHPTWMTLIVIIVWGVSLGLGIERKHESQIWCFIDSFGVPAVILSFLEIGRAALQ